MKLRALVALACLLVAAAPVHAGPDADAAKLNEKGIRLAGEGKYAAAIEAFTKARSHKPADLTLRRNLATARSKYGVQLLAAMKTEEAIRQLRFAVALEPGLAVHHANLGIALSRTGKERDGLKALERALIVDRKCAAAHAEIGAILYRRGELAQAIEHLAKASALVPDRQDLAGLLAKARREYAAERGNRVEQGAHFVVSWDGEKNAAVGAEVLQMLEDAYETVGSDLAIYPRGKVRVILYNEQEFREVTGAHDWVGGLYDGRIRIPVKNFHDAAREIKGTIRHEYTHVAVHAVTPTCPSWLNEGLAQIYEGRSTRRANRFCADARKNAGLMSLTALTRSFTYFSDVDKARLAYAQSLSITAFLMKEHGPAPVGRFLRGLGGGASAESAAESAFHRSLQQLYLAWEGSLD